MRKHFYASSHSKLLTPFQNKGVITALSANCTALVTTVAIMRAMDTSLVLFGVVTIELDDKIKKYFFRFYNMNNMKLLIQREIQKSIGMPFTMVDTCFIQMEIDNVKLLFEFIETFNNVRLNEFSQLKRALRGDMKSIEHDAEMRFYLDNPIKLSEAMDDVFNKLLHRSKKYDWNKKRIRINESSKAREAKYALTHWRVDPDIQNLIKLFGVNHEDVYKNRDCCQELEQLIAKYGGTDKFKQNTVQSGFGRGLDKSSPASPTLTSVTSPPENPTLSSVPKTPHKVVQDTIAGFEPAKQVGIPKNGKSLGKRFEEEKEFVASEVTSEKDASTSSTKPSTALCILPKGKMAEPAAKAKVQKRFWPDAFILDLNMTLQSINEIRMKREAEKKLKKEKKAKKKKPVSTTPEQTPEKEAPAPTEKTPVKEASKTPEKATSSVSDTTDETESDSDNPD